MADLSDYDWLGGEQAAALLTRVISDSRTPLQQLESLRRELSAERARLILEQVELRRRAVQKFGSYAAKMFFTPIHLEQATDRWIGQYKAGQVRSAAGAAPVHDYCCGIGGDLIWLARGGHCTGWDISPAACALAIANVSMVLGKNAAGFADVRQANVENITPERGHIWHLDPDRRVSGKRLTAVDLYSPAPDVVDRWLKVSPSGAVKLAPAAQAPPWWAECAELEWISCHRECRQQVAWFGQLAVAPGQRRATLLGPDNTAEAAVIAGTFSGTPDVHPSSVESPQEYVYDPDPSILAARLLGSLAAHHQLQTLGAGGAYLTSDRLVEEPLLQRFVVTDSFPLRPAEIARHLAVRNIGRIEIKKRGIASDPEKLRRELKLRGDNEATLILTRIGKREVAIVCQRQPTALGLNVPPALS